MKNTKKSFEMFEDKKKEEKKEPKESIVDRMKNIFKEEEYEIPETKNTGFDQENIYSKTKQYSDALLPKNMDPFIREVLEVGASFLIYDVLKKYKS